MNKQLSFEKSYRASLPVKNKAGETTLHFVGWVKTDPTVKLAKEVKAITPNHSKQMQDMLAGGIEALDPDAPTKDFYLATGAPGDEKTVFLGYFNTSQPALPGVIEKLWPNLQFVARED